MMSRCIALVFFVILSCGCGRVNVRGNYHDTDNPAVRYELRDDGSWAGELALGVPAGVFPHGSSLRLEGKYKQRGDVLELICLSASRQDPVSGEYNPEVEDTSRYNHLFAVEDGALLPVGKDGSKNALFVSDLNPLGVRKLVRTGN